MVEIIFEQETKYGIYRDALYLPDDHTYTQDEINAMEQERIDNWLNLIENLSKSTDNSLPKLLVTEDPTDA